MENTTSYKNLRYQHEILCARLEIREHYLSALVKCIYENIGQVLSLVRMQLVVFDDESTEAKTQRMTESSNLIGVVMADLRKICHFFYSNLEDEMRQDIIRPLQRELEIQGLPGIMKELKVYGTPVPAPVQKNLILFRILQEIFTLIKEYGRFSKLEIIYSNKLMNIVCMYNGEKIDFRKDQKKYISLSGLSIYDKVKFINGKLAMKTSKEAVIIKLAIPLK